MQLDNIEIFDKYQQGVLSDMEKQDFEAQLSADEVTQSAYQNYLAMIEGIRLAERQRLKEELLNSESSVSKVNKRRRLGYWSRIGVAASFVLLVSFGVYYCSTSNERIYAKFELGRADNTMSIQSNTVDSRSIFDEAIRLRDNQELERSLEIFAKVEASDTNLYFVAQYNMALLYTKNGRKAEARVVLTELTNRSEAHFIKEKANAMLKALDETCFFW